MYQHEIDTVYETLKRAKLAHGQALIEYEGRKQDLEKRVLLALADGTIEGRNAQAREAAAYDYFQSEYAALDVLQRQEAQLKLELDLAEIDKSHLWAIMYAEEGEKILVP